MDSRHRIDVDVGHVDRVLKADSEPAVGLRVAVGHPRGTQLPVERGGGDVLRERLEAVRIRSGEVLDALNDGHRLASRACCGERVDVGLRPGDRVGLVEDWANVLLGVLRQEEGAAV